MTEKEVIIFGKTLKYWDNQLSSATTALLLHGFRGNHKGLLDFASHLPNMRIIIPDLPGYGQSAPLTGKHNFSAYARVLNAFCNTLHLKKSVIIGHSFGASLALVFAQHYPQWLDKMVLIAPVTSANTFTAKLGQAYYRLALFMPAILRTRFLKSRLIDYVTDMIILKSDNPAVRQNIINNNQANLLELNEKVVIDSFLSFYETDLYAVAKKITAPTLIIFGDEDAISPQKSMQTLQTTMPNASCEIIPKAGHLVPLEEPTVVASIVSKFLNLT